MGKQHNYAVTIKWTGNKGGGTSGYTAYERSHVITAENKTEIQGSSDPSFRGDSSKYNPEELLVAALSSCHMLSYLHCCVVAGVAVVDYCDNAIGKMLETSEGGGHFVEVLLRPRVKVSDPSMIENAKKLHHKASELCFIASSVNFPVRHEPVVTGL